MNYFRYNIFYEHDVDEAFAKRALAIQTVGDANDPDVNPPPNPPACGDGNCINPATGKPYLLGDACTPAEFNKTCVGCPPIQCQFTKYEKPADATWMQWFNLFGFYWCMNFVTALGELILAGKHSF